MALKCTNFLECIKPSQSRDKSLSSTSDAINLMGSQPWPQMKGLGDVVQGANVELLWSTGVAWPCLVWVYLDDAVCMSRNQLGSLNVFIFQEFNRAVTHVTTEAWTASALAWTWCQLGRSGTRSVSWRNAKRWALKRTRTDSRIQRKALDDKFGWIARNAVERLLFGRFWRVGNWRVIGFLLHTVIAQCSWNKLKAELVG